jgi:hypothetical protein
MNCWMLPTASTAVVDAAKRAGTALPNQFKHRFGNNFVEVHLNGTSMFIFGAKPTSAGKYVYYEEWVGMEFQGWQQRGSDDAAIAILASSWGATLKETVPGKTFETELIMSDGTIMNMTFYLEHPQAPQGVKFSFEVLKPNSFAIDSEQPKMALAMNPIIRQHVMGNEPMSCTPSTSILQGFNCSSDIATISLVPDIIPGGCSVVGRVTFKSQKLLVGVSVQACYERDGNPEFLNDLDLSPFLPGIGSLRAFSRRHLLNSKTPYTNISAVDQYVVLPFSAGFLNFNNLSWDPDVTISLLFEAPLPEPNAQPSSVSEVDKSYNTNVVIIAVIVSVVALAAVIALVFFTEIKYHWLPFRKRSEELKGAQEPIDEEFSPPSAERQQNSRWSQGSRSRASLKNV